MYHVMSRGSELCPQRFWDWVVAHDDELAALEEEGFGMSVCMAFLTKDELELLKGDG